MPSFQTHSTPNPNALKITTDSGPFIDGGMCAFSTAEEAGDHPLGSELFRVEGVANVFILPDFLTITKHPAATWEDVMTQVQSILGTYFSG